VRLQLQHLAADCGQRCAEAARCAGQAAGVDDGQQHGHGLEAIQDILSQIEIVFLNIAICSR
jgi:hypothetical protein